MSEDFDFRQYTPQDRDTWDTFVRDAKNATFQHLRPYMDYHAQRFADCSLIISHHNRPYALLPACQTTDPDTGTKRLFSHSGLTFGGLLMRPDAHADDICRLFAEMNNWLKNHGFIEVTYKPTPHIYHSLPAEEDLYALVNVCHARLSARLIATTLPLNIPPQWSTLRRRQLRKAAPAGVLVLRDAPLDDFWPLLTDRLHQKYNATPVHSLAEIQLLKSRFPDEIVQYSAYIDGKVAAGITLYITPKVVHLQYSADTPEAGRLGALEAIYRQVADDYSPTRLWLDLGTSCENHGQTLNASLARYKESYGGRGICYDEYTWELRVKS